MAAGSSGLVLVFAFLWRGIVLGYPVQHETLASLTPQNHPTTNRQNDGVAKGKLMYTARHTVKKKENPVSSDRHFFP
jgi:hypothetical protein